MDHNDKNQKQKFFCISHTISLRGEFVLLMTILVTGAVSSSYLLSPSTLVYVAIPGSLVPVANTKPIVAPLTAAAAAASAATAAGAKQDAAAAAAGAVAASAASGGSISNIAHAAGSAIISHGGSAAAAR